MNPAWTILGALLGSVIGGAIVHFGARSRDRENDRRKQRVDYLVGAYRTLVRSAGRQLQGDRGDEFEDALSDVVLLGTQTQIGLVSNLMTEFAETKVAPVDPLLIALRVALRSELGLRADGLMQIPLLRMTWEGGGFSTPVTTGSKYSVAFDRALEATQELANAAFSSEGLPSASVRVRGRELAGLYELAQHAPGAAVATGYGQLADRLRTLLAGTEDVQSDDPVLITEDAVRRGVIGHQLVETVRGISILADLSRAGGSGTGLSPEKAVEFLDLVEAVIYSVERSAA